VKRNLMRWILLFPAALALAGCLDMQKVVHVRPDGSGYVEERMLMKGEAVAMLKSMTQATEEGGSGAESQLLDREKLAATAAAMGPGVTLASAEAISTPDGEGYVARYDFTDINQLVLDPNPKGPGDQGDGAPGSAGDAAPPEAGDAEGAKSDSPESVRFELRKGDQPTLIVTSPQPQGSAGADEGSDDEAQGALPEGPDREMAIKMMQQMFKGMHVAVQVEVEGDIVKTNATYRDGSRVTLVDISFDSILADPKRFEQLVVAQPKGIEEAKAMMQGIPGIKVETNDPVEIQFAAQ